MEQPGEANAIRLWSQNGAYVVAHDDKATVGESDDGSSPDAKWVVERVKGKPKVIRLKSCFGLYLTPTDGKVDWEPICDDGVHVKLKSWGDRLLLVNEEPESQNWAVSVMRWVGELLQGCCEPSHQNWVFWHVEDDTSSSNFDVESSMLAPLLQFNLTDTRAEGSSAPRTSNDFGQLNSP